MYWTIAIVLPIIGLFLVWSALSAKWRHISGEGDSFSVFQKSSIHMAQTFLPSLPGQAGYLDLKFSALRHTVVFIIVAFILFFANGFWESFLLWVNLLYTLTLWLRYSARKRMVNSPACLELHESTQSTARSLVKDSFGVVIYGSFLVLLSYILLFCKP